MTDTGQLRNYQIEKMVDIMRGYRLLHTKEEGNDPIGYPLIDALTYDGGTVDIGIEECGELAAELYDTVIALFIAEAEARGAAEQVAKGTSYLVHQWRLTADDDWVTAVDATELISVKNSYPYSETRTLYTRPANVAALEARVKELEGENNALKKRVINAAERLLNIETPCMEGDNFAVTICSHFEDCEGEPDDNGWHESATKAYDEIKEAILQHFRAALSREGEV